MERQRLGLTTTFFIQSESEAALQRQFADWYLQSQSTLFPARRPCRQVIAKGFLLFQLTN
jgi:hypothetical protein